MSSFLKNPQTKELISGAYGFLGQHVINYYFNKVCFVLFVKFFSKFSKTINNPKLSVFFRST